MQSIVGYDAGPSQLASEPSVFVATAAELRRTRQRRPSLVRSKISGQPQCLVSLAYRLVVVRNRTAAEPAVGEERPFLKLTLSGGARGAADGGIPGGGAGSPAAAWTLTRRSVAFLCLVVELVADGCWAVADGARLGQAVIVASIVSTTLTSGMGSWTPSSEGWRNETASSRKAGWAGGRGRD